MAACSFALLMTVMGETSNPTRILIVDDHTDGADSLAALLAQAGMSVEVAYSGEDALGIARRFLPDVVILDLNLPALDGFEVARYLRDDPLLHDAALLSFSGRADAEVLELGKSAGIDAHLTKPADSRLILSTIERVRNLPRS